MVVGSLGTVPRYAEHGPPLVVARVDKFDDVERLAWLNDRYQGRLGHPGELQWLDLVHRLPAADRYEPDFSEEWSRGNLLLNAGINRRGGLHIGTALQAMDNAHCRLGTGDGTTAVAATDTDLSAASGSTHRWFQVADSTYPTYASQTLTGKSTFASSDGNYAWNEWGFDQGLSSANTTTAPLYNRKVPASSMGTKASGASWALTTTITDS